MRSWFRRASLIFIIILRNSHLNWGDVCKSGSLRYWGRHQRRKAAAKIKLSPSYSFIVIIFNIIITIIIFTVIVIIVNIIIKNVIVIITILNPYRIWRFGKSDETFTFNKAEKVEANSWQMLSQLFSPFLTFTLVSRKS